MQLKLKRVVQCPFKKSVSFHNWKLLLVLPKLLWFRKNPVNQDNFYTQKNCSWFPWFQSLVATLMHITGNIVLVCQLESCGAPQPRYARNLLPRPGPNLKIVNFMAPTQLHFTRTGPDRNLYPQPDPKIFKKNASWSRTGFGPVWSGETWGFGMPHRSLVPTLHGQLDMPPKWVANWCLIFFRANTGIKIGSRFQIFLKVKNRPRVHYIEQKFPELALRLMSTQKFGKIERIITFTWYKHF